MSTGEKVREEEVDGENLTGSRSTSTLFSLGGCGEEERHAPGEVVLVAAVVRSVWSRALIPSTARLCTVSRGRPPLTAPRVFAEE